MVTSVTEPKTCIISWCFSFVSKVTNSKLYINVLLCSQCKRHSTLKIITFKVKFILSFMIILLKWTLASCARFAPDILNFHTFWLRLSPSAISDVWGFDLIETNIGEHESKYIGMWEGNMSIGWIYITKMRSFRKNW